MSIAAALLAVTIRVYDLYGIPPDQREEALKLASATLAHAGVAVTWVSCVRPEYSPKCDAPLAPGEMVLRFHQSAGRRPQVLGTAVVQPNGRNVLATAYTPAILDRVSKYGVPLPIILGRVAAHEIGHLLLGQNSHSPHGLMRAGWNVRDVHPSLWEFSSKDAAKIHARASERRAMLVASSDPPPVGTAPGD